MGKISYSKELNDTFKKKKSFCDSVIYLTRDEVNISFLVNDVGVYLSCLVSNVDGHFLFS